MDIERKKIPFPVKDLETDKIAVVTAYVSCLPADERPKIIDITVLYIVYEYNWIAEKLDSGAWRRLGTTPATEVLATAEQDSLDTKKHDW